MSDMEFKTLNNGLKMPMVGLGVYNISERETQKQLTLDGCIVISVGLFGHSGESTKREIAYAEQKGKKVNYLES